MPKRRLLLVDDDRLILATLSQGLSSAGYEVVQAASGEEAVSLAQRETFDLAVLDVRMPEMSGIDVAHFLHENTEIPFIFLSAYGDRDVVSEGVSEGALGYLVKPLDVSQLVPAIEAALGRATDLNQLRESQAQLTTALSGNRQTSVAVGLLMERYRLSEREAFERLRAYARSNRRKLHDVARDLVEAEGTINIPEARPKSKD